MTDWDAARPADADPEDAADPVGDGLVSWRALLAEARDQLTAAGVEQAATEARWIVERASGLEGAELLLGFDDWATEGGVARLDALVARRQAGEPLQYVLGSWGFRSLDLFCDRRALIPRPETEQVVGVALAELDRVLLTRPEGHVGLVADLGTGTGAIALSVAVERPGTDVWATDRSPDATAVARANLAGLGMAGGRVRIAEGHWFDALPDELRGTLDLVVTNPPYVAAAEELPRSVVDWEPTEALVSGPTGLEAYEEIAAEAGGAGGAGVAGWLAPGGVLVAEIGSTQADAVLAVVARAGLVDARVEQDHAAHDRIVVASRPGSS